MNTLPEADLLNLAAAALQEQLGQPVHLGERGNRVGKDVTFRPAAHLYIGEAEHRFGLEVKPKLTESMLDQLRPVTSPSQEPVTLVVPYVSDKLGQQLQQRGIYYLDTAGNAYLQAASTGFFILLRGNRQPKAGAPVQHRAFQPAGVQLLYHLLSKPALLQASYRVMAEQAAVALGSVSVLLRGLQQLDLLRDESGKRRWTAPPQVLHRWVTAYGEVVCPKLAAQRYRWLDPGLARQGWQGVELGPDMAWGGEPAAHLLLEGYLLPEYFTLYTTASRGEVMRRLRLVPDPTGNVEVRRPMATTLGLDRPQPHAVHPLLAYADLLLTADPRNREVAHLLHAHYLSYLA